MKILYIIISVIYLASTGALGLDKHSLQQKNTQSARKALKFTGSSATIDIKSIPEAQKLGSKDTISIMILGDIMMHTKQLSLDFTRFFEQLSPAMREADLCIANAEFTLAGPPYTGYPCFSAPDAFVEHLAADCGIDVFLTANNHILDYGDAGLMRSLSTYDSLSVKYGIFHTGSAANEQQMNANYPLIIAVGGVRVALVNFTYGTNRGSSQDWPRVYRRKEVSVRAAIGSARARGADYIIALPHWGTEYKTVHNDMQESWAKDLISWGADAVVGSHPHVVQDEQIIEGKPVYYSLGNAVSNMSAKNTQKGLIVVLRIEVDRHTNEKRVLETETRQTYCNLPGSIVSLL